MEKTKKGKINENKFHVNVFQVQYMFIHAWTSMLAGIL